MNNRERLRKVGRIVVQGERVLLSAVLYGMVLVVLFGVMVRYLPISAGQMGWTEEVARLMLLWLAYWGASLATRDDSLFDLTILVDRMGRKVQLGVQLFSRLLVVGILAVIVWQAYELTVLKLHDVSMTALQIPLFLWSLALLFAGLLMSGYTLWQAVEDVRHFLAGRDRSGKLSSTV